MDVRSMSRVAATSRGRRGAALAVTALAASTMSLAGPAEAETLEVPVFTVAQEGLTPDEGARLARAAGIGNALRPDGSFAFVDDKRFGTVPSTAVRRGVDEDGRATVSQAIDFTALRRVGVLSDAAALEKAAGVLPVPEGYQAVRTVGHTTFEQSDAKGTRLLTKNLDTTVSYQLRLGRLPVVGPGARMRVSFAGDGSVVQLSQAIRQVKADGTVPVINPDEARKSCVQLYGPKVEQGTPTLAYYAPALNAEKASGSAQVRALLPHYVCRAAGSTALGGKLVPAAPELAPRVQIKVSSDGQIVDAAADVSGGTGPYTVRWGSGTTRIDPVRQSGTELRFTRDIRTKGTPEQVTVTVTDANGIATTATVRLAEGAGDAVAEGVPGGIGGELASVGIEQTVDEWQCAQDSANGFRSVMAAKGHSVSFDWRGYSAWERDFKKTSLGGTDTSYVDAVDAQWYTGHGNPGGFTFKSAVTDNWIVPGDVQWGNDYNLEWMQLESCQVLQDVTGTADYFARWAPAFDGLHLLNGFHTNAYCVGGGTGQRFAEYLFPETFLWWTLRPALTVQQAWANMANDLEPAGTRWRSVSPAGSGWVTNLNDHFWGQGSVGPDIPASSRIGWVAISGVA